MQGRSSVTSQIGSGVGGSEMEGPIQPVGFRVHFVKRAWTQLPLSCCCSREEQNPNPKS